jgi:hypothetical protein
VIFDFSWLLDTLQPELQSAECDDEHFCRRSHTQAGYSPDEGSIYQQFGTCISALTDTVERQRKANGGGNRRHALHAMPPLRSVLG